MEPITVVTTIGAVAQTGRYAWAAASSLVELINESRHVDRTIRELATEAENLATTCYIVRAQLKDVTSLLSNDPNWERIFRDAQTSRLWFCINAQIRECHTAVEALSEYITTLKGDGQSQGGFFRRASKQLKLNRKQPNIDAMKSRISMSVSGLYLSMQAITIQILCLAPQRTIVEIASKIDALQDSIKSQNRRLRGSHGDILIDISQYELLSVAEDVLTDANSFRRASVSSEISDPRLQQGTPSPISRTDSPHAPSSGTTEVPSEAQMPLRSRRSPSPTADSEDSSSSQPTRTDTNTSDDSFNQEYLRHTRSLGQEAYDSGDFEKAEKYLESIPRLEERLQVNGDDDVNGFSTTYHLAMCAIRTKPLVEAESILLRYLENSIDSDKDAERAYNVSHHLSQVYVYLGKLDLATTLSDQTIRGRWRLLGSKHRYYFESLALMVRIQELQRSNEDANVYRSMITGEHKDTLHLFRDLKPLDPSTIERKHNDPNACESSCDHKFAIPQDRWIEALELKVVGRIQDAIAKGDTEEAMSLIQSGVPDESKSPNPSALHLAALYGYDELVEALLQRGSNCSSWCNARLEEDTDEVQPLHLAIAARRNRIIQLLVEAGAPLDKQSQLGNCAPSLLIYQTRLKLFDESPDEMLSTLEILKSLDFDLNSKLTRREHTFLHLAFTLPRNQVELRKAIITFLLDNDANLFKKNRDGFLPIHSCMYLNGCQEDLELLLRFEPERQLKALTCHGNSALHIAMALRDHTRTPDSLETMKILCEKGADVNMKTWLKISPLKYAKEKGDRQARKLLEQYEKQNK